MGAQSAGMFRAMASFRATQAVMTSRLAALTKTLTYLNVVSTAFSVAGWITAIGALKALEARGSGFDKAIDSQGAELSRIYGTLQVFKGRIESQGKQITSLERQLDSFNFDYISLQNKYEKLNNIAAQANSNASKALTDIDRTVKPKLTFLNNDTAEAKSNASQALLRINNIHLEPKIRDLNDNIAEAKSNASQSLTRINQIHLEPKIRDLNDDTAEAKSNASQALARINNINLEPKIRDLNDDTAEAISNASQALVKLKGLEVQKSSTKEIESRLNKVEADLRKSQTTNSLTGEIKSIRNELDSLKNQSKQVDLSSLNNRIGLLEKNMTNLKNNPNPANAVTRDDFSELKNLLINKAYEDSLKLRKDFASMAEKPGVNGLDGRNGRRGADGKNGIDGKDGKDVNPKDVLEIKAKLQDIQARVLLIPAILPAMNNLASGVNSNLSNLPLSEAFKNGVSEGVCRTTKQGGCVGTPLGNINTGVGNNAGKLDELNALLNAADLGANTLLNKKMDDTLQRLGPQVDGGLSGKIGKLGKWLGIDRVLNVINTWMLLHNAYFLSSNLTQTLFGTVDSVLQVFGITLKDDEGDSITFGEQISSSLDGWAKSIFGVSTWEGIKEQWKSYSRVYQAGANIVNSFRSISDSILSAMEIVGSQVSKIGNALRKAGEVAENAFPWMNQSPNFQNRFFTAIERTEEFVSAIDSVAQEVISVQESVKEIEENRKELSDALKQAEGTKQGTESPEAEQTKKEEDGKKQSSIGPNISSSDLIKTEE